MKQICCHTKKSLFVLSDKVLSPSVAIGKLFGAHQLFAGSLQADFLRNSILDTLSLSLLPSRWISVVTRLLEHCLRGHFLLTENLSGFFFFLSRM
jgi:hypothetical protein